MAQDSARRLVFVALVLLVSQASGQSAEWSQNSAAIAALCTITQGAAPTNSLTLSQTSGTKMAAAWGGSPDAVWLKDAYGTVLAYSATPSPGSSSEFDIGKTANNVKLFAHYTSCHVLSSSSIETWKAKYNNYVSDDAATFSTDFTAAQIASAAPTISANYASSTATVTFDVQAGITVPHAFVKDSDGLVLAYRSSNTQGSNSMSVQIPAGATSITACTLSCVTVDLTSDVVSSIESSATASTLSTCSTGTCDLPTSFAAETLTVGPSASCVASGGAYTLFAKATGGAVIAYGTNTQLSVPVQGQTSVLVYQQCAGALGSMPVEVEPLRTAYTAALSQSGSSPSTQSVAPICVSEGVTHALLETWKNGDGESCQCVQGVVECGGSITRGIWLDNGQLVGVVLGSVVIATVIGALVYFYYMQSRVVEGRRRSISGQTYYGSSRPGAKGSEDVELPAHCGMESSAV